MAANRVVLWRHGQTDWTVVNRFQGHSDIDLNEVGVFQAKHAAQTAETKVAETRKTLASMASERLTALKQAAAARERADEAYATDQQHAETCRF